MNTLKKILRFFPNKIVRKYIGGYWENWRIELDDYWLNVSEEDANDKNYSPPTVYLVDILCVEYYPYNFFGKKSNFTEDVKSQYKRELKFKRILK